MDIESSSKWLDLNKVLTRKSPFQYQNSQETSAENLEMLQSIPILVVGAGGLGCQILKNLALSGFKNIHVIDLDTIDLTNLNRQFLFRMSDVNKHQAVVAANFIKKRVQGCNVTPYTMKIQEIEKQPGMQNFYSQFFIIIAGLDNIEARRWLNQKVHDLVEWVDGKPDPNTVRAFIDGGTEGFKGQARIIIPYETSCYQCTQSTIPPQVTYALCTINNNPTKPEHCIAWAYMVQWEKVHGTKVLDKDDPEHMKWICEVAQQRAKDNNIQGVDYFQTMGVVKSIIPAIASTNAIIAACCTNEALQFLTHCSLIIQDYFAYFGHNNINNSTTQAEQLNNCQVCSQQPAIIKIAKNQNPLDLIEILKSDFQLQLPSLVNNQGVYLHPGSNPYFQEFLVNASQSFETLITEELFTAQSAININDQTLQFPMQIFLEFV